MKKVRTDDRYYNYIKGKLEIRHKQIKENLLQKHKDAFGWVVNNTKQIAAGAMGSLLLLTSPTAGLLSQGAHASQQEKFVKVPDSLFVISDIKPYLPDKVGELIPGQEEKISEILSNYYGFKVLPEINGMRLINTYGYIGLEQHLARFPGDSVENMASGLGAYGYFAQSQAQMTQVENDREKYYIAVQTFLARDYAIRTREYNDFFKFRKMLVVNPNNGRAIVAVIGDAGPAVWTGKQLGGSPEVMNYLQRIDGSEKGPVLYFFIDDPSNSVPLGPVEPKLGAGS